MGEASQQCHQMSHGRERWSTRVSHDIFSQNYITKSHLFVNVTSHGDGGG